MLPMINLIDYDLSVSTLYFTRDKNSTSVPSKNGISLVSTPDRHLCLFGTETTIGTSSTYDPMLIRFSNQEDINTYTPTAINTAGTQRLADGSKIIGTLRGRNGNYIWSDTAMFTMRFIGAPFTFGFEPFPLHRRTLWMGSRDNCCYGLYAFFFGSIISYCFLIVYLLF